jgi:uncharacterized membrane protein
MNASQIHLALTHVPVILSLVGLVILIVSMLRKSDVLTKTSYYIFLFAGLFALPVFFTGESTEEIVEKIPGVSESIIEEHEGLAKIAMAILIAGIALSLAGLLFYKKVFFSRVIKVVVLVMSLASAGVLAQTAHLGGQIRHSEIRSGFSAQVESVSQDQKQIINQKADADD